MFLVYNTISIHWLLRYDLLVIYLNVYQASVKILVRFLVSLTV